MKIAFFSGKMGQKYASQLVEILKDHAPHHQYSHHSQISKPDLWHYTTPDISVESLLRASRTILSLHDIRFITSPRIYPLSERLFKLPLYRLHCRHAARIITHNEELRNNIASALGRNRADIEVCRALPLLLKSTVSMLQVDMDAVRAKFDLPQRYILILGEAEARHNHTTTIRAILSRQESISIIIYGRETVRSRELLKALREDGQMQRVQFIYEASAKDRSAIVRMAQLMIYMPLCGSSPQPIFEAMVAGVPMILSDTPHNREWGQGAAIYLTSGREEEMVEAIESVIGDQELRDRLIAEARQEAKKYTNEAIAKQLSEIYESL